MHAEKMTSKERVAVISLSSIMGLRMLGLFMVLPVFTLYAQQLQGATPLLVGLAIGIYGLFQALFQIPFGVLSDRWGRKPIILAGLLIFAGGSLIAGLSGSIIFMIIGRALQGIGAIGSTILALMADLTSEEQRTKSMAIAGISIGFSFSAAMLIGPLLITWLSVSDLFFIATVLGLVGIAILYLSVPNPPALSWHRDTEPELHSFLKLLVAPELAKLNAGIFILHAIFTASFVVLPIALYRFVGLNASEQWMIYLPTLFIASIISLTCIGLAEKKSQAKPYFLGGIAAITLAQLIWWQAPSHLILLAVGLCLFFGGFTLLESFLPSLISRTAPATRKGSALGIYSCSQFLGIFMGGALGGWLYGQFSFTGVYLFCIALALFWFFLALLMQAPRYLITQMWRIPPAKQGEWASTAAKLHVIPGIVEVTFIAEEGVAYLKMERGTQEHPDFLRLREHTIANL